jgi:hypothetical protein
VTRQLDELRASGDDINQFLESLVQKALKSLPNRDLSQKDLRVQKGRRAIYGQTQRGFRQDLGQEDIKALDELISQPTSNSSQAQPSRSVPNYQISVGDEVLFRSERDGTVSVNRMQLENQQNLAPESQKEAKPFLEQTKEAFGAEYDPDPPYASDDLDGDRLTNALKTLQHTDPQIWDTDSDGIGDGSDSDPTNGDLPQSQAQDLTIESQSESESVSIIEPNEIPEAVRVAERDVEKLPEGKGKQLFGTLVENIAQKASEIGYQTINAIANLPTWKQNQDVANTALKLFNQNYEKTGETRYEAVGYNVTLKGLNNYEISDKEGNSLMKFQKTPLGVKVKGCEMEARDYKQFNRAKQSLERNPDSMERDSQSRLARLQYLAPQRDREIVAAMYVKDTAKTAERFLEHMGVDKWNAGVKGNYNIERQGNDLKIESKADGRGVVFERKNGEIIARLDSKDFKHFRDLDRLLNKRLQEIVSQPTNNLRERPLVPKVKREKELSL